MQVKHCIQSSLHLASATLNEVRRGGSLASTSNCCPIDLAQCAPQAAVVFARVRCRELASGLARYLASELASQRVRACAQHVKRRIRHLRD
jgi:hypothetical protein